ncbi:MAG: STIV orfB116 family protein [Thermocrinis sp.]|jgi:hypothetical protein|uniref:STIV orfB116 family protein n=1 Tax=Thermocrinis sp. TaxID=2024383 RepID=UPI003BFB07D6
MTTFIANAFSISMLHPLPPTGRTVKVRPVSLEEVKSLLREGEFTSAVGHESTARVMSALLGVEIAPNRAAVSLSPGDRLIVFQLAVRLPEGAILTADEVLALYQEGKASFVIVEVGQ